MKKQKIILLLCCLVLILEMAHAQGDQWTQAANFGGSSRIKAVGFSIGNKGYIGTGIIVDNGSLSRSNDFWEYDPLTNAWTQKANFGGPGREGAVGFSIANKGYIGTGHDGINFKNDFWEYDPLTNTWAKKGNFAGQVRDDAVGFSIGDKGYIGTGVDATGNFINDFWEYDPSTDAWAQKTDLGESPRFGAVGFSIGNKGYIGTGFGESGSLRNDFWEYDPSTNIWIQKTNFGGTPRGQATGFCIGNKGYLGTGIIDDGSYTNDFWEYDPSTDVWTQKAIFPGTARRHAVGFSVGNKGYAGTGSDGNFTNDFWKYTPSCVTYYRDQDGDGFGNANNTTTDCQNTPTTGYVANNTDCDDNDAAINPNTVWYLDADNDGYYTGSGSTSCTSPGTGYKYAGLIAGGDCNDDNPNVHPGATEICSNGLDDNCDGQVDEDCVFGLPSVSINDVTVYESEGVAVLTVSLSNACPSDIKIGYATADGTATSIAPKGKKEAGVVPDYVAGKGKIDIAAGSLSATISLAINYDGIAEPDETFTVTLSLNKPNSKIASISKGTGTVTILDGSPAAITRASIAKKQEQGNESLSVESSPNPSNSFFTISVLGNIHSEKVMLRVMDMYGRVIESRNSLATVQTFNLGENYRPGIYVLEVTQGSQRKILKLVKQ